jgi:hypothetical protein
MDHGGQLVIGPQLEAAANFVGDPPRARVKQDGRWGLVDSKGKFTIRPRFEEMRDFDRGLPSLAAVKVEGRWGWINRRGNFVIEPRYEDIDPPGGQDLYRSPQGWTSSTDFHLR